MSSKWQLKNTFTIHGTNKHDYIENILDASGNVVELFRPA